MTNRTRIIYAFVYALILSACGSGGEENTTPKSEEPTTTKPTQTNSVLAAKSIAFAADATCPNGGIEIELGVDTNNNAVLDVSEVTSTERVCHGADGQSAKQSLVNLVNHTSHNNCANSAIEIQVGMDNNGNNLLDNNEVSHSSILCSQAFEKSIQQPLLTKGTLKGKVPTSFANNNLAARYLPSAQSLKSFVGIQEISRFGDIFLVPEDVANIINNLESQASDSEIIQPVVDPIKLDIDENGQFEVELPAGTNYKIIATDDSGNLGAQIDNISVSEQQTTEVEITNTDLVATGSAKLTVQSLLTGNPIDNATITLLDLNSQITTSTQGIAELNQLAKGSYQISISAQGYVTHSRLINIESNNTVDLGAIELNHQYGKAVGSITSNDLQNLANVLVYAKAADGSTYTSITNPNGHYKFSALPIGQGYSIIVYANDFSASKLDNIDIELGLTTSINPIQISRTDLQVGSITGFARFAEVTDSMQHAGIIISIENTDFEAITARDGSYVFNNIPTGNYTINLTDSNHITQTQNVTVSARNTTNLATKQLQPVIGNLTGTVKDENNQTVADASISINTSQKSFTTVTNEQGAFSLNGVFIGEQTIYVSKQGYTATSKLVNIQANNTLALNEALVITHKSLTGNINLGDDAQDHSGVSILAIGTDLPPTISQTNGEFTLYGLDKGQYKLLFSKAGFISQSVLINKTDEAQSSLPQIITLEKDVGSLTGQLTLTNFGTTDNLTIQVLAQDGTVVAQSSVDNSGNYIISNVPPKTNYNLKVSGTDSQSNQIETLIINDISVAAGTTTQITQDLTITLVDPNPPVISDVTFTDSIAITQTNELFVNPSIYVTDASSNRVLKQASLIEFNVVASDKDGDDINYQASASSGKFTKIEGNKFVWLAPEEGAVATLSFTATSNQRSDTFTQIINVNHKPDITLLSPDESTLQNNDEQQTYSSIDIISMSAQVTDYEDGDITGEQIKWYSDSQGLLTTGAHAQFSLKPGKHVLYIEATDSQQLTQKSANYYVTVTPPETMILKTAGTDIDWYSQPIDSQYKLNIEAADLTLNYTSSDADIALVSESGLISAQQAGASKITVVSTEVDDKNQPLYETELFVRVIDKADKSQQQALKANQIYQIQVDSSTIAQPFVMSNLAKGHYSLILFDQAEVTDGSNIQSRITSNSVQVTDFQFTSNAIHNFEVADASNTYEVNLVAGTNYNSHIKLGLFPGVDVRDSNGYLNITYWDAYLEKNDAFYLAAPISFNQTYRNKLAVGDAQDYYSLDVVKGETYTFSIKNIKGQIAAVLYGATPDAQLLTKVIGENWSEHIEYTATFTGKITLQIKPNSGSAVGEDHPYELAVYQQLGKGLTHNAISYEPNENQYLAFPINIGSEFSSSLTNDVLDIADYYSFNAIAGESYTIQVTNEASSAHDLKLTIGNKDNLTQYANVSNFDKNSSEIVEFKSDTTGKIYIKVAIPSTTYRSSNFYYTVSVHAASDVENIQSNTSFEPNNSRSLAYKLATNSLIESELAAGPSDVADYYYIDAFASKTYSFDIANISQNALSDRMQYTIEDSTGYIYQTGTLDNGKGITTSVHPQEDMPLYLKITPYNQSQQYKYKVQIAQSDSENFTQNPTSFEPNNSVYTAYPISLNQTVNSSLAADPIDSADVYSFNVEQGKSYQVEVNYHTNISYGDLYVSIGTKADQSSILGSSRFNTSNQSKKLNFTAAESSEIYITLIRSSSYQNYQQSYDLVVTQTNQ